MGEWQLGQFAPDPRLWGGGGDTIKEYKIILFAGLFFFWGGGEAPKGNLARGAQKGQGGPVTNCEKSLKACKSPLT